MIDITMPGIMMPGIMPLLLATCTFDKTPTLPILIFEAITLVGAVICYLLLSKLQPQFPLRCLAMAGGVLIFELFTAPMWHNQRMGVWAYIYQDVSWILTIGWTALLLTVVVLTDRQLPNWKEWKRFLIYLGIITVLVCILEAIVVNIGIRGYAPEVLQATSGIKVLNVPIEVLYYTPVFTGLVLAFYKYWTFVIDDLPLIPVKKRNWLRAVLLAFTGVFLFEVMIEPLAQNLNLPNWSYIFHDISILMTGLWVLIIGLAAIVVNQFFIHLSTALRFVTALAITSVVALPVESLFILNGYRVYGASAVHNFSGFTTPITNLPVEIAFAIPFYMALIIAFIRYWEIILDNRL